MKINDDILLERAYSLVKEDGNGESGTYNELKEVYGKAKEIINGFTPDSDDTYFAIMDLLKHTYFLGYNKGSTSVQKSYNLQ